VDQQPKHRGRRQPRPIQFVAFECELYEWIEVGGSILILGEVVHAHVDEGVLTDGKLDIEKLDTVGRLAGSQYASTAERFAIDRPD